MRPKKNHQGTLVLNKYVKDISTKRLTPIQVLDQITITINAIILGL